MENKTSSRSHSPFLGKNYIKNIGQLLFKPSSVYDRSFDTALCYSCGKMIVPPQIYYSWKGLSIYAAIGFLVGCLNVRLTYIINFNFLLSALCRGISGFLAMFFAEWVGTAVILALLPWREPSENETDADKQFIFAKKRKGIRYSAAFLACVFVHIVTEYIIIAQ